MNEFDAWLLAHEAPVRTAVFVFLLAGLGLAQGLRPFRGDGRLAKRQAVNLALIALDTAVIRLAFPVLGVAFAARMAEASIGMLHRVAWPDLLELALALLLLDCAIYWQHRLFHRVPWFWRAHRVHHADLGFDVTLGVRFHPLEIVLSQLIKFGVIALTGAAPLAVLVFEIVLFAGSLVTHTDISLPAALDRRLRWLLVTPDMHRIHHSARREETDSNYGFHLSLWDRLFRSYRPAPHGDPRRMPIGLEDFRAARDQGLLALLAQPFRNPPPPR